MANILEIEELGEPIQKSLARLLQSGHINFLIGSGASYPAIAPAGNVEKEIAKLFDSGDDEGAAQAMGGFIKELQAPMNLLINEEDTDELGVTLGAYDKLLGVIERILSERRTDLLPKQATIFTTNYDLFIEKASIAHPGIKLNDGFSRVPSLNNRMEFSSQNFFNRTYNSGNLYEYKVEIPAINLLKLHGSLSWQRDRDDFIYHVSAIAPFDDGAEVGEIEEYLEQYAIVLPESSKFRTTTLERTYYELLRIFANQLDRENTLLVSFGFSFGDEHLFDIVRRALKNPTLKLMAFAFNDADVDHFENIFGPFNNVDVIAPPTGETIDFEMFNKTLSAFIPSGAS